MLKKRRCELFAILSCLLIEACASAPPDVPACEHFAQRLSTDPVTGHLMLSASPSCMREIGEPECGHCVTIMGKKESFIGEGKDHWLNGKPWSKVRQESVYLPAEESYVPLAKHIIDSCKQAHCDQEVEKFKVKLNSLNIISGDSNP